MVKNNIDNSFAGETKRIIKVGKSMGGIATKFAAKKFFGISKKSKNASDISEALGGLKGPIMKVAQLISSIPDAIPDEYAEELSKLQAEAPSMGWLFVKRRMSAELGNQWQKKFILFEKEAAKAASLGQVHRAKVSNEDYLACKLQYPDMHSAINADLKQLKLIMNIYTKFDSAIQPENIFEELSERLKEELDYNKEKNNINLYRDIFKNHSNILIPKPLDKLSTSKLLTMSWLTGKPLKDFYSSDISIRNFISKNLFKAWYLPFYQYGIIHGDPHPGNYTIADNGKKLNLLDFGCIRIFKASFIKAVINLYIAIKNKNDELAISSYESWGFKNLSKEHIKILNIWANFIYGPLIEDKKRQIQDLEGGAYGKDVANKVHKELKKLGGVKPPREFVLVDRAAIGLGSVFMNLKAEVNWHRLFEDMIAGFSEEKLEKKQLQLLIKNKLVI